MKLKLFSLIALCFVLNFSFGQTSSLSITSEKEAFILHLNSKAVNSIPNQVVVATGLNPGKNHVRLSFSKKGIPELNAQLELPMDGQLHQVSYKVVAAAKGPYSLVLVSDIILGQNQNASAKPVSDNGKGKPASQPQKKGTETKPAKPNSSNTTPPSSVVLTTQVNDDNLNTSANSGTENVTMNVSATDNGVNTSIGSNSNGTPGNAQINISINASDMGMNSSSNSTTKKTTTNNYAGRVPQVANGLACANPSVNSQAFMQLKYKISQVYLDMNKAKEAKDFMNNNCMTSAQVADLVKLMQMADTQLDVAQFGFMHTFDQAKYEIVVNALMADYNKEKLLGFIGSYDGSTTTDQSSQTTTTSNQNQTINYTVTMSAPQTTQTVEPVQTTTTQTTTTYQSYNSGCTPMDSDEFEETLEAADEPINEDKKMEVVKSIFDDKCLNTTQVASIVDLFINEDRKLDVAKWAFSRTSDKDKYFRINKAFINEQRKAELSQFVKNNK